MPVRLLIILESEVMYASALVRGLQYKESFAHSARVRADFVTRQSDRLNAWVKKVRSHRVGGYWNRLLERVQRQATRRRERRILAEASRYDLVYLIKVPAFDFHMELCALKKPKVMLDINDGLWLPGHRMEGYDRVEDMMMACDALFCENCFLREYAERFNSRVFLIPDSPQYEFFEARRGFIRPPDDRTILGWIGSPRTADSLYRIFPELEKLFAGHPNLQLRLVGASPENLPRFEQVRYSFRVGYGLREMVDEVLAMHVGLFPLFDMADSYLRGNLKARIYMAGGCAALCQRLGENISLITDGENGMLASEPGEWMSKLAWLVENPEKRSYIASRGLETIRSAHTISTCFDRLEAALIAVFETAQCRKIGSRTIGAASMRLTT